LAPLQVHLKKQAPEGHGALTAFGWSAALALVAVILLAGVRGERGRVINGYRCHPSGVGAISGRV
jgi:hypothetical protein